MRSSGLNVLRVFRPHFPSHFCCRTPRNDSYCGVSFFIPRFSTNKAVENAAIFAGSFPYSDNNGRTAIVVCFKLPHAVRVRNQLTAKLAFYRLTNHVQTSIMGFFVYIPGKNTQSVRTIFPMVAKNYHIQGIFCQVPCKTFSFIQNSSKTARRTPY